MNEEEFESCKEIDYYDDFMENALKFDELSMEDYQDFMPKVLPVILSREEKDPVELFEHVITELRKIWTASETLHFTGHGITEWFPPRSSGHSRITAKISVTET